MANEEGKVNLDDRINAACESLERVTDMVLGEGAEATPDELMAQFATSLEAVGGIAQDPYWNERSDKHELLQLVYGSIERSRTMAHMLMAEPPRTPSFSPPDCSASLDASVSDTGATIDTLLRPVTPAMRLCSVAGMAQAKQLLTEAVVMPIRYRHLFTGARKPWHSVLLYGPPGTGKTKLAVAVAAEVDAELYCISPSDLLSSWFGRTEQNIRDLFGQLRARSASSRVIVFLDEVDGLCRRRTSEEPESTRRMKTELLGHLQGDAAAASTSGHLFFVCATNCPWEIDPAFLRRFQQRIFIGLPDRDSRRDLIRMLACGGAACGTDALALPVHEWENLLDRTEGFSGSDLCDLVRNAMYQPVRELSSATHWQPVGGRMWSPCSSNTPGAVRRSLDLLPPEVVCVRSVTGKDFHDVIESARATVCEADLQRYEDFTNQFGQVG